MEAGSDPLRPALQSVISQLALDVADAQLDTLLSYLSLLRRWNAHYNLTAVRDPAQMLTQHLADCLAVIEPLRRKIGRVPARMLDVGSGGGLPGVVIAILDAQIEVTCVDAVGKKAAFVRQVAGELRLQNLLAQHARVEQLQSAPFDVVTSRAFASLPDFTALTRRHLGDASIWMAMKGRFPGEELALLTDTVDVFHVEQLSIPDLDAERCLVWMRPNR